MNLEEFNGQNIPRYAILSHTWEDEEVTLADYVQGQSTKQEWSKIHKSCKLAAKHNLEFVWIDTCCIDKSSSAELTEAINSMYTWYANSDVCFAYLGDYNRPRPDSQNTLRGCRWFTRGWTLQELIAAPIVQFYDALWQFRGAKHDLCDEIAEITRIDRAVLPQTGRDLQLLLKSISVCQKMSWAADRQTTRKEDTAYCLLGLFRVNMPLLYGEGAEAFIRLQEEIIKRCNDLSIFAWQAEGHMMPYVCTSVLAPSPREFMNSRNVVRSQDLIYNPEFTMTNKGIRISVALSVSRAIDMSILSLHCHREDKPQQPLGIYLSSIGGEVYGRTRPSVIPVEVAGARSQERSIFLTKQPPLDKPTSWGLTHGHHFRFRNPSRSSDLIKLVSAFPEKRWDKQFGFRARDAYSFVGINTYRVRWPEDTVTFVIACGFAPSIEPWVCVSKKGSKNELWAAANSHDVMRVGELGPQYRDLDLSIRSRSYMEKIYVQINLREFQGESEVARWYEVAVNATTRKPTRARNQSRGRLPASEETHLLEYLQSPEPVSIECKGAAALGVQTDCTT
ncbi:uncharacterized protein JN550_003307 [Neoarthrinium moseri]|uniref:uncharacterized protein n=1 Tax=Neoarthrinium moseri TaxID=1658444 RepID=UPI001FDE48DE|nr:uncharacterized protein JN550_003307 [Neoarthrinium moseri]KAI1873054.1 hypothetical protein JN550_003307 [Neoarthrinium moseri]